MGEISTISRRELSSSFFFFFLHGKALKEIHTILTETLACFLPGQAKDISTPLYRKRLVTQMVKWQLTVRYEWFRTVTTKHYHWSVPGIIQHQDRFSPVNNCGDHFNIILHLQHSLFPLQWQFNSKFKLRIHFTFITVLLWVLFTISFAIATHQLCWMSSFSVILFSCFLFLWNS